MNSRTNVGLSSLWRRCISFSSRTVLDTAARDGELRVFVVAGEVSGDGIGSRLMASLKKLSPVPVCFAGVGGEIGDCFLQLDIGSKVWIVMCISILGEERLKGLTGFVEHVLCILPGEEEVCKSKGLDATFVGHPILEDVIDSNQEQTTSQTQLNGSRILWRHVHCAELSATSSYYLCRGLIL